MQRNRQRRQENAKRRKGNEKETSRICAKENAVKEEGLDRGEAVGKHSMTVGLHATPDLLRREILIVEDTLDHHQDVAGLHRQGTTTIEAVLHDGILIHTFLAGDETDLTIEDVHTRLVKGH